jgi:Na+/H+ antiporter NhaD/arsenite permease-like protein
MRLHWLPIFIFLLTYLAIAVESHAASYLDRTAAAFCGSVAMVLAGVLTLERCYDSIDWNTLVFLLGMMILVAHFRVSGFFDWVAVRVAVSARTPLQLLTLLVFTSGILSAFFVNDTICLIFTPIVLAVTDRLRLPARPYISSAMFRQCFYSVPLCRRCRTAILPGWRSQPRVLWLAIARPSALSPT